MRKVILNVAVSLDNLIEGPRGEYDWCFTDQDYGMSEFLRRTDTVLMGRKSYELIMKTDDSYLAGMKRYVFSRTLNEVKAPDTILVRDEVARTVRALQNEVGGDMWLFGGASLISTFMKEGLVDELVLAIHPLVLGRGKPLFHELTARTQLRLTDSRVYDTGLVQLFYQVLH